MSAFAVAIGGKADMLCCAAYVRFWPKADVGPWSNWMMTLRWPILQTRSPLSTKQVGRWTVAARSTTAHWSQFL